MSARQKIEFLSPPSDCFMADDWYKFATGDHFWVRWRFEALRRIIPKDFVWGQTLDIGCGTGIVRDSIEKFYGCSVSGCDLNIKALQMAIESSGPLYFYNIHQQREEFRGKFSTILLLDVLEHIQKPTEFLRSVGFHLRTGGSLIVNVPAFQSLYSEYDKAAGHMRRYNIPEIKNELHSAGFHLESAAYWGLSLIPLLVIRKFILRFYSEEQIIEVGFQPGSPLVNKLLQLIMRIEYAVFSKPPAGTSLIVMARKVKT